jgi:acyl dehydratase
VRYLAPVCSGKRVRAQVQVEDVTRKDEQRFLITDNVTVEIEGEKTPALIAEWLALVVTA